MGRIFLKIVAELYGLSSEYLQGTISREELYENSDTIYGAKASLCNLLLDSHVLRILEQSGWSVEGVLKLVKISDKEYKIYCRYWDEHLKEFAHHRAKKNKVIKEFKNQAK